MISIITSKGFTREIQILRLWGEKMYIHMSIWMAGRNLKRKSWHQKMHYTVILTRKISAIKTKNISDFGIPQKKTLGCYHDIYLKTNILLLADVHETFQNTCFDHCKLARQVLLNIASEYCEHEGRPKDWQLCLDDFRKELLMFVREMMLMFQKDFWSGITQVVKHCQSKQKIYEGAIQFWQKKHIPSVFWRQTTFPARQWS